MNHSRDHLKNYIAVAAVCILLAVTAFLSEKRASPSSPSASSSFAPSVSSEPIRKTGYLLNTFVMITIYDSSDTQLLDDCFKLCEAYENQFSRTISTSELYQLNHRENGETTFTLSEKMAELLRLGLYYSELSDGAFDITIEPVTSLWDFSADPPALPDADALKAAAAKTGWQNLKLEGNQLTFLSPDTTIDLGAIAKGYIADQLKSYLVEQGVSSAIINLGGNVLCIGEKAKNTPFLVGLRKPFAGQSDIICTLDISDLSVVTSGVYERHFIIDGKNYHHLLNPHTGYPYDNGIAAVTILSERSVDGDGLSTACFSLGLEKGMELVNSLKDTYAFFIMEDGTIQYSDGAKNFIEDAPGM